MAASASLKRQVTYCNALRLFLEELGVLMRWNGDTLPVLIEILAERQTYAPLSFLKRIRLEMHTSFSEAWRAAVEKEQKLPEDLYSLLLSMGESLGTSDLEGQLSTLGQYLAQLEQIYQAAWAAYRTKGKLFRSMGLLGGMSAALLLC